MVIMAILTGSQTGGERLEGLLGLGDDIDGALEENRDGLKLLLDQGDDGLAELSVNESLDFLELAADSDKAVLNLGDDALGDGAEEELG